MTNQTNNNKYEQSANLIKLLSLGFQKIGEWTLANESFDFRESDDENAQALLDSRPALYAHVVNGEVMYVGKTTQQLRKRLYGYRKPGKSQATNARCNQHLKEAVREGGISETFAWLPIDKLFYEEFQVNLAAGLEDSIIEILNPIWNGGKTETSEIEPKVQDIQETSNKIQVTSSYPQTFSIKLGKTYWNTGFMNPGVKVSKFLGEHEQPILIELGKGGKTVPSKIDRTANLNRSPRIYGGGQVRDWWQRHFSEGDTVTACILNPRHIVLLLPGETCE